MLAQELPRVGERLEEAIFPLRMSLDMPRSDMNEVGFRRIRQVDGVTPPAYGRDSLARLSAVRRPRAAI